MMNNFFRVGIEGLLIVASILAVMLVIFNVYQIYIRKKTYGKYVFAQEELSNYRLKSEIKKSSEKIRSFIYLDKDKMYSISSQLFEGLSEYILKSTNDISSQSETQKGLKGSGKILADIMESSSIHTEKKYMHDYAYNLFESTLIENNYVLDINKNNVKGVIGQINDYSFVKITSRVIFNDMKLVQETTENFNIIGEAITRVSTGSGNIINKAGIKEAALKNGLGHNEEYLKALNILYKYGYNGQLEIQLPIIDETLFLFTGLLKREMLTEEEVFIRRKYSPQTEKEFTIFAILTQTEKKKKDINILEILSKKTNNGAPPMRELMINLVDKMSGMENFFTQKLEYEYVLDPIAVYLEI